MLIQALEFAEATVLFLVGDLDEERTARVRETVEGLVRSGRPAVVLDLSGVDHLYAAGMAILVDLQRNAASIGTRVLCCGARPFIRELVSLATHNQDLELKADLESALDAAASAF